VHETVQIDVQLYLGACHKPTQHSHGMPSLLLCLASTYAWADCPPWCVALYTGIVCVWPDLVSRGRYLVLYLWTGYGAGSLQRSFGCKVRSLQGDSVHSNHDFCYQITN
jgi:hypothetical protein